MKRFVLILGWSIAGGLLLGAVGLIVGFFGPLLVGVLVGSEANLGPLWGIFVLGPVGMFLGGVTGAVIGYKKIYRR